MNHASPDDFISADPVLNAMTPRLRVAVVAEMSGLKPRHLTALASKGQIPGAAKHGSIWTFDRDLIVL